MSYDLMVFSPTAAPKTKPEFMVWYETQTAWAEDHSYDDPAETTPALQAWLQEMERTFPDINGSSVTDEHASTYETDYSIGKVAIYAAFSWSLAREASETAQRLAQKHQVGFWDPSFEGPVLVPENGKLRAMDEVDKQTSTNSPKPWWKLW